MSGPDLLPDILMQGAVIVAAFFQAVTGIGFGMIAGPPLLMILGDSGAVVVATCMSWLIALVLLPLVWRGADRTMVLRLLGGAALGMPVGLVLLAVLDVTGLKLLAAVVIGALTAAILFGLPGMGRPGKGGDLAFGGLAGGLGGCLAVPGPVAILRMTGLGRPKIETRATMIGFFVIVWPLILAGQVVSIAPTAATFWTAAACVPGTLAGLALGNWAAGLVSERVFRNVVLVGLCANTAALVLDAAQGAYLS